MVIFSVVVLIAFWLGFLSASVLAMSGRETQAMDPVKVDGSTERTRDRSEPLAGYPRSPAESVRRVERKAWR